MPPKDMADILFETIQREGMSSFLAILRKRANSARALPGVVRSFTGQAFDRLGGLVKEIRSDGLTVVSRRKVEAGVLATRQQMERAKRVPATLKQSLDKARDEYRNLPTVRERTEFLVLLGVYSASYLGGFFLGFQLPKGDLNLVRKGHPTSWLTLYSAPLFSVEIAIEWMREMLDLAAKHGQTTEEDRKAIANALRVLENLSGGVSKGFAAGEIRRGVFRLRSRAPLAVHVPLDDHAYRVVENLFTSLSKDFSRNHS